MKKIRGENSFIKKPVYKGGRSAMNAFIKTNMKYPPEAIKQKIEGKVQLKYEIDYKGNVPMAKVVSSLGYGCDEEAERLVKLLKFEMPKNPRKVRIKFNKSIRINFKIPNLTPKPKVKVKSGQNTKVIYRVTKSKESTNTGTSYTYTITI